MTVIMNNRFTITFKDSHKEEIRKIVKFGIIGVINTLLFFTLFFLFFNIIKFHYLLATTISYFLAIINSFAFNKKWTFESNGNSRKEFIKFCFVNCIAIIVNSLVMFLLVDKIGLNPWFAQVLTICVTMCVNYLGNRLWTFVD